MALSNETKKALVFILLPLTIFLIPGYFLLEDYFSQKKLDDQFSYTIGTVEHYYNNGPKYYVTFRYQVGESNYSTNSFPFNRKKPLYIGLPVLVKFHPKEPQIHKVLLDSIVNINDSITVHYYNKIYGGWTYELVKKK